MMLLRRNGVAFTAILLILVAGLPDRAPAATTPEDRSRAFVADLVDEAFATITAAKLPPAELERALRRLLVERFDLKTIGRFCLGAYWQDATPAERNHYQELFQSLMVRNFVDRFARYEGEPVDPAEIFRVIATEPERHGVTIRSEISRDNDSPVRVGWRLRERGESLKVIDVMVQGISMLQVQREEVQAVAAFHHGNMPALLRALEARLDVPLGASADVWRQQYGYRHRKLAEPD